MVKKLENLKIIKPYHPQLASTLASAHHFVFSRQASRRKSYGQYKLGHGDRSVVWYWEFSVAEKYFHEFRTVKFTEAMKIYEADKQRIWVESWVLPSTV
jgi:hypothetical protein